MRVRAAQGSQVVVVAAVTILLLQLLLRGPLAASSWFFQDDFYLATQASRGLTADFLLQEYSGHIMPAGLLLLWAVTWLAPLEWALPLAVMMLLQLAIGLVLVRSLLLVVGRRAAALAPVALFALTPLTLNSVLWWGSGLQSLPHQLGLVLAVDGHLRYLRWGRRRHALQSLAGVGLGLAFYQKVLLVPVLLLLLSLLPLAQERGRRRLRALRTHRAYWAAHAGLATAYAGLYLLLTGGPDGSSSPPGDWPVVAAEAVRTVAVALVGGPWRGQDGMPVAAHLAPPGGVVAAVLIGVGAVVAWTVVRGGRRARDAWLVLAVYLLLDVALLLAARGSLAPFLASDPRYYADAAPVAALALGLALRAVLDAHDRAAAPPLLSRPAAALVGVAGAVVVVGSVLTTLELGDQAERHNAREYVDRMRLALRSDPTVAVADAPASPRAIVESFLGGEASVAHVIGALPEAERLRRPGTHLRVFDRQGRLVEGILLGRLHADSGPDGDCGYRVNGSPREVPLRASEPTYSGHVKVSYFTGSTRAGTIEVAGERHQVVFQQGVHDWWVPVDGVLDAVVVSAAEAPAALCVTEVEAGRMWPPKEPVEPE